MAVNPKSLENLKKWKAGQCGNPNGRGVLEGIIRKALEIPDPKTKRAALEDIVAGLIQDATVGVQYYTKNGDSYTQRDNKAVEILFERGYGKPKQDVDINSSEGLVINVVTNLSKNLVDTKKAQVEPNKNNQPKENIVNTDERRPGH